MRPALGRATGALVVALLAVGAASARLVPGLGNRLVEWGPANMMTLAGIQIVIAASGILPASMIAVAAGATFGIVQGFALCAASTMVGGFLAFLLARSVLRPWIARWSERQPAFARLDRAIAAGDWKVACLIRLSPVMPFAATSYGLGLTRMTPANFMLGMVASLPALLGYVSLGALGKAGVTEGSGARTWLSALTLGIGIIASLLLAAYLRSLLCRDEDVSVRGRVIEHA
jgi:uncharacterized membrane protein YdjX (TVP38/TMEM64 family)